MRISDWSSDVCSSDLGIANAGIGAECRREVLGEKRLELVVELVDPKIDRLGAAHQPVDLGKLLAKSIELGKVDAREVLALVHQHLRFVPELLDLLVHALEGARGGEDVLRVVARVEDGDLRVRSEEHTSELQSLMRISYA